MPLHLLTRRESVLVVVTAMVTAIAVLIVTGVTYHRITETRIAIIELKVENIGHEVTQVGHEIDALYHRTLRLGNRHK